MSCYKINFKILHFHLDYWAQYILKIVSGYPPLRINHPYIFIYRNWVSLEDSFLFQRSPLLLHLTHHCSPNATIVFLRIIWHFPIFNQHLNLNYFETKIIMAHHHYSLIYRPAYKPFLCWFYEMDSNYSVSFILQMKLAIIVKVSLLIF